MQEAVVFTQGIHSDQPFELRLNSGSPADEWIQLDTSFEQHGIFVSASLWPQDDDVSQSLSRVRIDTGFDGFLGLSLTEELVSDIWISEEYGQRTSRSIGGVTRSWSGAVSGFMIGEIFAWPMPVTVSDVHGPAWAHLPLLGQGWFEQARAVFLDIENGIAAVSFSSAAVDRLLGNVGEHWVQVPWTKRDGSHLRYLSFNLYETAFEAILDTGSSFECLIVKGTPPVELTYLTTREKTQTGLGQVNVIGAQSSAHASFESYEVADFQVWWVEDIEPSLVDVWQADRQAILGLPFLRRGPVIFDMERDRILIRQDQ